MYELRMGRGKDIEKVRVRRSGWLKLRVTPWDDSAWKKRDKVYRITMRCGSGRGVSRLQGEDANQI